jgi:hypothetical protein
MAPRFPLKDAKSLEPAPPAVETAANNQHYDDNDQKSCCVRIVLLLGDKREPRGQGIPEDQKGPANTRDAVRGFACISQKM